MDDQKIVQATNGNQGKPADSQKLLSDRTLYRLPVWPSILVGAVLVLAAGGGAWWLWNIKSLIADPGLALTFFAQTRSASLFSWR